MKKFLLATALVLAVAGFSFASSDLDFTLVNETGKDIHDVYVSPANVDHWGEDIMGKDILANGEQVEIKFAPSSDEAVWDLKVKFGDGSTAVWEDLHLPDIHTLTLKLQGNTATAIVN